MLFTRLLTFLVLIVGAVDNAHAQNWFEDALRADCVLLLQTTARQAQVYRPGPTLRRRLGEEVDSVVILSDVARLDRCHDLTLRTIDAAPSARDVLGSFGSEDFGFNKLDPRMYEAFRAERTLRGIIDYDIEPITISPARRVRLPDLRPGLVLRIDGRFLVLIDKNITETTAPPTFWQPVGPYTFVVFDHNPHEGSHGQWVLPVEIGAFGHWIIGDDHVADKDIEVVGHAHVHHRVTNDHADAVEFKGWTHVSALDESTTYRLNMKLFTPFKNRAAPPSR